MAITFVKSEKKHIDFSLNPHPLVGYHTIPLYAGWNNIGYDGATGDIASLTSNIIGLEVIYLYEAGQWFYYNPSWPESQNTLLTLEYGKAYQIKVSTTQDWQVPNYEESEPDLDKQLKLGVVGANWWSYSSSDRKEIAKYAIEKYSVPIYGQLRAIGEGQGNCAGEPYTVLTEKPLCYYHFFVRYCILGNSDLPSKGKPLHYGYWRDNLDKWHCLYCSDSFKLPVYHASLVSYWYSHPEYPTHRLHSMCALQIGLPESWLSSWIFFQYNDTDIKPGVTPKVTANTMKAGDLLQMQNVIRLSSIFASTGDDKYTWEITQTGADPRPNPPGH